MKRSGKVPCTPINKNQTLDSAGKNPGSVSNDSTFGSLSFKNNSGKLGSKSNDSTFGSLSFDKSGKKI